MDALKSIVVGVDFTPCSVDALEQAIRISRWNHSQLHVIHVIECLDEAVLIAKAHGGDEEAVREGMHRDAREAARRLVASISGVRDLDVAIVTGHPVAMLLRTARRHSADLLVLATRGTTSANGGTGTTATACVRKAMTMVLLVREQHAERFERIVACIDFSDTSYRALEEASRVAARDKGELHVLHVCAPLPAAALHLQAQYEGSLSEKLRCFCERLTDETRNLKPKYAIFSFPGSGRGIINFAQRMDADLLVLGTRGQTNMQEVLWGSTAERVVRDAPCSIIAIKPAGFEHPLSMAQHRIGGA